MLRILRETGGGAVAVDDTDLEREARDGTLDEGVDLAPEGGAALAAAGALRGAGDLGPDDRVVAFNTGAGWLYREPGGLPPV
jgi:threonine synthase